MKWSQFVSSDAQKRLSLAWRKTLFFTTPRHRRVAIRSERDGRHISFLLASLVEMEMAVQPVGSPFYFRDIQLLNRHLRIASLHGAKDTELQADILITDDLEYARLHPVKRMLLLDHDFFNENQPGVRMPYFMAPSVFYEGLQQLPVRLENESRRVRLGFFGTHNPTYYTRHFHFPVLARTPILERFLEAFGDRIKAVSGAPETWERADIAVAMDHSGGDQVRKVYLSHGDYLEGLNHCDFLLCPPGWCMPVSHNLVEGMAHGAIPLLNYPQHLTPPLEDGVNCLAFTTLEEFEVQVRKILTMPHETILRMRHAVLDYYQKYFAPGAWLRDVLARDERETRILVNNECYSLSLRDPQFAVEAASFLK